MSADFDLRYDTTNFIKQIRDKKTIIEDGTKAAARVELPKDIDKIIIMGMGGSRVAGTLIRKYFPKLNVIVLSDYETEEKINSKTAIFICSYSGETEEALHFFNRVATSTAKIAVITSGGPLRKNAQSKHISVISLMQGLLPRAASIGMFFAIMTVLTDSGLVEDQTRQVETVFNTIANERHTSALEEYGRSLAEKIGERIPLIYSSSPLDEVAYVWKTNFNENSKTHAFNNSLPELCHNELNAFASGQNYYAIILLDDLDMRRMKDRASVLRSMLNGLGIENTTIMVKGPSVLSKMFSTIMLGEFTSYFLALLHGKDPVQIELINSFKSELSKKRFF